MTGSVSLDDPFLRLTVYEMRDEETNLPVLKCIDNRRLHALKEYARRLGDDDMMVHISFISDIHDSPQRRRIMQNSDQTSGEDIRIRKDRRKGQCR